MFSFDSLFLFCLTESEIKFEKPLSRASNQQNKDRTTKTEQHSSRLMFSSGFIPFYLVSKALSIVFRKVKIDQQIVFIIYMWTAKSQLFKTLTTKHAQLTLGQRCIRLSGHHRFRDSTTKLYLSAKTVAPFQKVLLW